MIIQGDCLKSIPVRGYALAYLDPPYFTGRNFGAFDDRWPNLEGYVEYIGERCVAAWLQLIPGGSLVLHLDWHASHYLKVWLDRFDKIGYRNFASEIVWRYRRWPAKTPNFQRVHDILLRYVKPGANPIWNQLYEPLAESTRRQWGTGKQLAVVENGKRKRSSTIDVASPGVPIGDVWDISIIAPSANERTGYPTQKPEKLIERLILSLTNPGQCVLDPFCGSATVETVARRLGRECISIDNSQVAIDCATKRLAG